MPKPNRVCMVDVSTHSRLKAAGVRIMPQASLKPCFNTQPPKGGWYVADLVAACKTGFNTQPPKGGWLDPLKGMLTSNCFNTQPPKGGWAVSLAPAVCKDCFNTQPPKGGWFLAHKIRTPCAGVSTHSRLKAAGET